MYAYFLVFIGGGFGSICRYGIAHWLSGHNLDFPLATFLANAISCIILGMLIGLQLKSGVSTEQRFLLMTGFCGGFSTFSTFTGETLLLFQEGAIFYAFLNIIGSLLICLLFMYLGIRAVG